MPRRRDPGAGVGAVDGVAGPDPSQVPGAECVEQVAVHADDVVEVAVEAVAQGQGAPDALDVGFPNFEQ